MRWLPKKTEIKPQCFVTCSGSRKKKVFSPFYDGKKMSLIESGEIDIQDEINAHGPECDMSYILSRLKQGDMSVLNGKNPIFADFHNLPKSFREVLDVALSAERIFNSLPVDVRRNFDNDYRKFVSSAGTSEWMHHVYGDALDKIAVADAPVSGTDKNDK